MLSITNRADDYICTTYSQLMVTMHSCLSPLIHMGQRSARQMG